jgi:CRP-like cAMP-binding protein
MDQTFPRHTPVCNLHVRGQNRLLTMLEKAGQADVVNSMERVTLKQRASLVAAGKPITHAFFPLSGVASLVVNLEEGPGLEVGTMGNEGMVGIPLLLGANTTHTTAFVQVSGEFMRVNSVTFSAELRRNAHLAAIGQRYVQAFFSQAAQSAACVRFHQIEQRLCRWILHSHDRVGDDVISLTQEFLALMLGVQRPGVSLAAAQLQHAGLIRYRHGIIEVLDRAGIEASACECYGAVRQEYERLLC